MTKQDFIENKQFVVGRYPGLDWVYTEHFTGGEVRIMGGYSVQLIPIEELTPDYFVIKCWLTRYTDGKIYFRECELK